MACFRFRKLSVIGESEEVGETMLRQMLRAKIHRALVTDACLEYEGSLTVDEDLLDAAGILPYEFVMVSNLNNGERFTTYAINGKRGPAKSCSMDPQPEKG